MYRCIRFATFHLHPEGFWEVTTQHLLCPQLRVKGLQHRGRTLASHFDSQLSRTVNMYF